MLGVISHDNPYRVISVSDLALMNGAKLPAVWTAIAVYLAQLSRRTGEPGMRIMNDKKRTEGTMM